MSKHLLLAAAMVLLANTAYAPLAEAQYRGGNNDSRQNWSRLWNTREGASFDQEEVRQWRQQNSRVRDAIADLDEDQVEHLPIPVLFGVGLTNLYPNFGDPRDGGARTHEGFDMMAADGTPIVSPTEAVVIRIGNGSGSGRYVSTANPGDETFVYMHLSDVADIKVGDRLEVGDLIGYVGNTGNASGGAAHLHFEIRDGRTATDPYPRLTREFTLTEKMRFLNDWLDDTDDPEERAEFLVAQYQSSFIQARLQGLALPDEIEDALPATVRAIGSGTVPARDLQLGDQGPDVVALQSRLIAEGFLALSTPTDQFGPLTQSALIAYQRAKGISPASGYYGPLTRATMGGTAPTANATTMTREQLIAEIERLLRLIAERSQ